MAMLTTKLNSGVSLFRSRRTTVGATMSGDKNDETVRFKQPLKIGVWNVTSRQNR